jgi:hypothetical protein
MILISYRSSSIVAQRCEDAKVIVVRWRKWLCCGGKERKCESRSEVLALCFQSDYRLVCSRLLRFGKIREIHRSLNTIRWTTARYAAHGKYKAFKRSARFGLAAHSSSTCDSLSLPKFETMRRNIIELSKTAVEEVSSGADKRSKGCCRTDVF